MSPYSAKCPASQAEGVAPSTRAAGQVVPSDLRRLALVYYCFEAPGTSIAQMAVHPPFNGVSRRTLENWSVKDRWADRRHKAEEALEAEFQKKMGAEHIQKRRAQLESLEEVEKDILEFLESGRAKMQSFEGGVRALIRLAEFMDALREKVLGYLPGTHTGTPENVLVPDLTRDEAREAAQAILEHRRKNRPSAPATQDQP